MMGTLGIDPADCDVFDNIGSNGVGQRHVWRGGKLEANFSGVTVLLPAQFSDTPFILLGRDDFFYAFSVKFDQRNLRFTLEEC